MEMASLGRAVEQQDSKEFTQEVSGTRATFCRRLRLDDRETCDQGTVTLGIR